jgi:hypothetical protein
MCRTCSTCSGRVRPQVRAGPGTADGGVPVTIAAGDSPRVLTTWLVEGLETHPQQHGQPCAAKCR